MIDPDYLYHLLPEYHRSRDASLGEPLRAFMRIFQEPLAAMHTAVGWLYEDWFIETCEDAAVPLIAELVGVEVAPHTLGAIPSQRSLVANTLRDRRRKGSLGALQAALRDASGWTVRAVESGRRVAATADLQHGAPAPARTAGLRQTDPDAADVFEDFSRSARLRSSSRQNVPACREGAVDVFVWSATTQRLKRIVARPADSNSKDLYAFHPLGVDTPLFRLPQVPDDRYAPVKPDEVPAPIEREALRRELRRESPSAGRSIRIEVGDPPMSVPPACWFVANLSTPLPDDAFPPGRAVAIDPELGRFQVHPEIERFRFDPELGCLQTEEVFAIDPVRVSFAMAAAVPPGPDAENDPEGEVPLPQRALRLGPTSASRLLELRADAADLCPIRRHVLLRQSGEYTMSGRTLKLGDGERLSVSAETGVAPVVKGPLVLACPKGEAEVVLKGLWFTGSLALVGGVRLRLVDCVLHPSEVASITGTLAEVEKDPSGAPRPGIHPRRPTVQARRSVVGRIAGDLDVGLSHTVVDGNGGAAVVKVGSFSAEASTILGSVDASDLSRARGTIFEGTLEVQRTDQGIVEGCYVPADSQTPPRYQCLPRPEDSSLRPAFRTVAFGQPGYARLRPWASPALLTGGEHGSEMGAFNAAFEELRRSEMARVARAFLPLGIDAQFVYET